LEDLIRVLGSHPEAVWNNLWLFNLSDPAVVETLYESVSMRRFVDLDIAHTPVRLKL
jgi:hypothetical protein